MMLVLGQYCPQEYQELSRGYQEKKHRKNKTVLSFLEGSRLV